MSSDDLSPFGKGMSKWNYWNAYGSLYERPEWHQKSEEILKRDNFICTNCLKSATKAYFEAKSKQKLHYWIVSNEGSTSYKLIKADKPYYLQIHHKYYINGKLPWDYDDDALITICNWCHNELHKRGPVPQYTSYEMFLRHHPK